MRRTWIWILLGWLMISGVAACHQIASQPPAEPTSTPLPEPSIRGSVTPTADSGLFSAETSRDEGNEPTSESTTTAISASTNSATPPAGEDDDEVTKSAPSPPISPTQTIEAASRVTPHQTVSNVFLVYDVHDNNDQEVARTRSLEAYREKVTERVTRDLATRIGVSKDAISVVKSRYLEVQVASPCGSTAVKGETGAVGGGLSVGLEVVLETEGARYRYVALSGLGTYCGRR